MAVQRDRWISLWTGLALLLFAAASWSSGLIELRTARATVTVDGQTQFSHVVLPYHWDRRHAGQHGAATFDFSFPLPELPEEPWGLFIPRLGNVFEVRLNGSLLQRSGELGRRGGADFAKAPVYVPVPPALLRAGLNQLQIRIDADTGRRAGLSELTLGPAVTVRGGPYASAYAWRYTSAVLLTVFSLILGSIALALWLTQVDRTMPDRPRRENIYLWAALAEFCWALRMADTAIPQPPLDWVAWGTLMTVCYTGWIASTLMFCNHVAGWSSKPRMRWMPWVMAAMVVGSALACWIALAQSKPRALTGWLAVEIVGVTLYASIYMIFTLHQPNAARLLVAAVGGLAVIVGTRDWLVIRLGNSYGETTWLRYISVFFGIALLSIMLNRFRSVSTQARDLVLTLDERVAQKERELAVTYSQLEEISSEQARNSERARILCDMHDGVGSLISAAIRQVQSGRGSKEQLLRTLRDSLEQLKLSIDALHLAPGDIGALLAGMRYRLTSRFADSGLTLEWDVDELPLLAGLDGQGMRHVQFLLFEAFSNVLQHAHATILRIEARALPAGSVQVRVIDNGLGFDVAAQATRQPERPSSLHVRAAAIGARLMVESQPGCSIVQIEFRRPCEP